MANKYPVVRATNTGKAVRLSYVWDTYEFHCLISTAADPEERLRRLAFGIGVVSDAPKPLPPDMLANAVAALRRGRSVLLLSDRRELCDFAMREMLAMAGPA